MLVDLKERRGGQKVMVSGSQQRVFGVRSQDHSRRWISSLDRTCETQQEEWLRESKEKGGSGVKAEDCVFLDDIGENLKTAKTMGMNTIKVVLGKTWRAVKELEQVTGLSLMDEKTRRSKL